MQRTDRLRAVSKVFWALAIIAIIVWSIIPGYVVGWDLNVYRNAVLSVRAGHDPYADGMAVQRIFHAHLAEHPNASPPYTYVYSPLTLPLLRAIGRAPLAADATIFWLLYALAAVVPVWVALHLLAGRERRIFSLLAPAAIFFPGLLQHDTLFSGNVVYILYGLIFAAAYIGWKRRRWGFFYPAVLFASCFKAPLLVLLAIPVLSARRQWAATLGTAALGVGLFAVQSHLWPELFRHYLQAVELQFSFNHDFSSSPNGLFANALFDVIPYQVTSAVSYLILSALIGGLLFFLSRRFLDGAFTAGEWLPVMLTGVLLLYPRIMEYDTAPFTLPVAIVLWRVCGRIRPGSAVWLMAALFAVANGLALLPTRTSGLAWHTTECVLLLGTFFAGAWNLLAPPREQPSIGIESLEHRIAVAR